VCIITIGFRRCFRICHGGLELNVIHQHQVCADAVNSLKENIGSVKKNIKLYETLLRAYLEVKTEN
jgi:hypothetical protein